MNRKTLVLISLVLIGFMATAVLNGQDGQLRAPVKLPKFAVAKMAQSNGASTLELSMASSNGREVVSESFPMDAITCTNLSGDSIPASEFANRFATPVAVIALPAGQEIDMNFFQALVKDSTMIVHYAPVDDASQAGGGTGDMTDAGSADPVSAGFVVTLKFDAPEGTTIQDIRRFEGIAIDGQIVPFGEEFVLNGATVYVQRKESSLVVHGVPTGKHDIAVSAVVKMELENSKLMVARNESLDVTKAATETLTFEE